MRFFDRIYKKITQITDLDLIPLAANNVRWRSYRNLLHTNIYKIDEVDFTPSPITGWVQLATQWKLLLQNTPGTAHLNAVAFNMTLNKRGKIVRLKVLNISSNEERTRLASLLIGLDSRWRPAIKNNQLVNIDMDFSL